jgi:hypothetical protein
MFPISSAVCEQYADVCVSIFMFTFHQTTFLAGPASIQELQRRKHHEIISRGCESRSTFHADDLYLDHVQTKAGNARVIPKPTSDIWSWWHVWYAPSNMCESPAAPQDSHKRLILDRTNVSRQQTIHDHALLADEVMGLSFSGGCCSQLWEVLLTTCNCTDFGGPGWG